MEQLQEQQEVKLISMDMIQSQQVEWLWYPYISFGKITIVQGDPGEGKTTFALNLAARISKGERFGQRTQQAFLYLSFIRPQRTAYLIRLSPGLKKQRQIAAVFLLLMTGRNL